MILFGVSALLTITSAYLFPPQRPETDEGARAHIFQLSVMALVPVLLLFLATADWRHPLRSARPLVIPMALLILAFGALYFFEHH